MLFSRELTNRDEIIPWQKIRGDLLKRYYEIHVNVTETLDEEYFIRRNQK